MKKTTYITPLLSLTELSVVDVISTSESFVDEDGVIQLRKYGFGNLDIGGLD